MSNKKIDKNDELRQKTNYSETKENNISVSLLS
jgi:hypothetical protein